jgi:hypothetical protein
MAGKKLLRPQAVEEIYDISIGHQAKMRCSGIGPAYIKIGSKIYYEEAAIERRLDTKRRASTSDPGPADGERAGAVDASALPRI